MFLLGMAIIVNAVEDATAKKDGKQWRNVSDRKCFFTP